MAVETKCMTPGANYYTHIQRSAIIVEVILPHALDLTEDEAVQLDLTIHNALELALAPTFARASCNSKTPKD